MATVGGSGLASQMRAFDPERVDELVRVYREHNKPLHAELAACDGMIELLEELQAEGRRLGIVSAKRRATVELAFAPSRSGTCSTWSSAATRPSATSRIPSRSCSRSSALGAGAGDGGVRRRLAVRHAGRRRPAGWPRSASPGAGSTPANGSSRRSPTTSSTPRRSCLPSSLRSASASCAERLEEASYAVPRPRRPGGLGRRVRPPLRRAGPARERAPELRDPNSLTTRVGAPPSDKFRKVEHLRPMGSLEKVTSEETLAKWADDVRKRLGSRRAGRLRDRAEDRRLRGLPHLRERRLRPRRHARRRHARRGRDAEPAHDQVDPAADAGPTARTAAAARGARRGLHAALRLPAPERAPRRRGQEDRAEPAQRRRRLAPAAEPADHGRARRWRSGSTASAPARASSSRASRRRSSGCASTASARTRSRSGTSRSRRSRASARSGRPRRIELDYEIDGIVIKVDSRRPAAAPRRAARAAALGARLQVGADDRARRS